MAVDYLLKIDGVTWRVEMTSTRVRSSWSRSAGERRTRGSTRPGGGGGSGKVQVQDLLVSMHVSKASPMLMLGCATGKHHKEAVLTVRRVGVNPSGNT